MHGIPCDFHLSGDWIERNGTIVTCIFWYKTCRLTNSHIHGCLVTHNIDLMIILRMYYFWQAQQKNQLEILSALFSSSSVVLLHIHQQIILQIEVELSKIKSKDGGHWNV